jgi:MSHA biogenesis protein MshK
MAEPLKRIIGKSVMRASVLLPFLMLAPLTEAQNLVDPTRPPASHRTGQDSMTNSPMSGPVLQSVLVSPERKVAVISGQAVRLGEKFGDARVIKITENEVKLKGKNGVQTLKLYPGVEKDLTSNRKDRQAEGRRQ